MKKLTIACLMLMMSTVAFAQQGTSHESRQTTIDFVYGHYANVDSNGKWGKIVSLDDLKEYLLRFSITSRQIVFQILSVDRLKNDNEEILETHFIAPQNSFFEIENNRVRVIYKENGDYKGFTFTPSSDAVMINDLWSSDGVALKNRFFFPPDENQKSMIEGLNRNKNFSHTHWGETDYSGKYNKLKRLLQQFRWKDRQ